MQPLLSRRQFTWIALGFIVFVVYGSLVPLEYRHRSFNQAVALYQAAMSKPLSFESRSDWLANILLFIPLGFTVMGSLAVDRKEPSPFVLVGVLVGSLLLSAAIEFVQLWFPARYTSLNDVVAETFGAVIGVTFWMIAGQRLTNYARSLWSTHGTQTTTARWIPAYLIFLVIIHGMPFDLTLSPGELKQKYMQGRVVIQPFTYTSGGPLDLVRKGLINFGYFLPAGILLAGFRARFARNPFAVLGIGLLLASAIEFMQLFVYSRYCDVTDIVTGSMAVFLGWFLMLHRQPGTRIAGFERCILLFVWLAMLCFIHGEPFRFNFASNYITARFHAIDWIPFVDYYRGNYLTSFELMLQKLVLFIPIGILWPGGRFFGAILVAALVATLIEAMQLFSLDHHPGVSDLILETIGGGLGYLGSQFGGRSEPTAGENLSCR